MPPRKARQTKKNVQPQEEPQQEQLHIEKTQIEKPQVEKDLVVASFQNPEETKTSTQSFFNAYNITPSQQPPTQQKGQEQQIENSSCEVTQEAKLIDEVNKSIELQRDYIIPENVISQASQKVNPTQFYLYHDLEKQAIHTMGSRTRLDMKELESFGQVIKLLDTEGMRICFVIIRMHALKQKIGKLFDLPYSGKIIKEYQNQFDIEFDLKNLPGILQKMLLIFAEKHIESANISSQRQDEDIIVRKKF